YSSTTIDRIDARRSVSTRSASAISTLTPRVLTSSRPLYSAAPRVINAADGAGGPPSGPLPPILVRIGPRPARFALSAWPPERRTTQSTSDRPLRSAEEDRLARLAVSDRSVFSALYEAHVDRVYRSLLSRTSDPAEAEELTSRVFL